MSRVKGPSAGVRGAEGEKRGEEPTTVMDGQLGLSRGLQRKGQNGAISGNYIDRFRYLLKIKARHEPKTHGRSNRKGVVHPE